MSNVYRKPHTTMNRKHYGNKVKPVKDKKEKLQLEKPSVLDLKRIYSQLTKSASWQRLDILSEAIQWYRGALRYIATSVAQKNMTYSAPVAKSLLLMKKHVDLFASQVADKEQNLLAAMKAAQYVCNAHGIKAPAVLPYLQKSKVTVKRLDKKVVELSGRYDKLLTLLMQAYGDGLTLKVSPTLETARKFNHTLNIMFYSTKHIKVIASRVRNDGLLPVVIDEAWHTARAQAFALKEKAQGQYIATEVSQALIYQKVLTQFAIWASISKDAPKSLVRRQTTKKKKVVNDKVGK